MQISNAEWRIMKIIWMEGKQTSTDLIAVLSERFDWSKSTIKTLLTRLVAVPSAASYEDHTILRSLVSHYSVHS